MTARITSPGVYLDLPAEIYHGTPTPEFPASCGFITQMEGTDGSPAKAWYESALNPSFIPKNSKAFDIGTAAHLILLENDRWQSACSFIDADDYRTKLAQEARDRAYKNGQTPLLPKDVALIMNMRDAFYNRLPGLPFATAPDFAGRVLGACDAEISVFARDETVGKNGIWTKCRPDGRYIGDESDVLVDYKTMATGGLELDRYAITKMGWHRRAAWYIDTYKAATGRDSEYWFLGQSKDAPHFCKGIKVDEESIQWGRRLNQVSKRNFAKCLDTGRWPSGVEKPITVKIPDFELVKLKNMEDDGYFKGQAEAA